MSKRHFRLVLTCLAILGLAILGAPWASAETERVSVASGGSPGNGDSHGVDVSGEGRYVVFSSDATNLVPGGSSIRDVYVRDRDLGLTELVSRNAQGSSVTPPACGPAFPATGAMSPFTP